MNPSEILTTDRKVIKYHKVFNNSNNIFTGTYHNLSPADIIEEFSTFGEVTIGDFKSILIESDRVQVSYTNAFMFLTLE